MFYIVFATGRMNWKGRNFWNVTKFPLYSHVTILSPLSIACLSCTLLDGGIETSKSDHFKMNEKGLFDRSKTLRESKINVNNNG